MELDIAYQNISRIIDLQVHEKSIFNSLVEIVSIRRNELLLAEGQICKYEYFILSGCLRSFYLDKNLIERTTMFAVEGSWTGNLKSFTKNVPSEFNVEAIENSVVLRIDETKLDELYSKVPKFEKYFRVLLQNRLLATQDRVNNHLSDEASKKYIQFCEKFPNISKRVPLKYIASYLGITPTYLSRIRRKIVKK
jgi:CRP-like cAMP-binding protein